MFASPWRRFSDGGCSVFAPAVALMNRLRYPQKLALMGLLAATPLAVTMFLLVSEIHERIAFAQKEQLGTTFLRPISRLMQAVLLFPLANETEASDVPFSRFSQETETALALLAHLDRDHGASLGTRSQLAAITTAWDSWKSDAASAEQMPVQQLANHLAAEIRQLMVNVGDYSNLILDPDLDSYYTMEAVLIRLPDQLEILGQTHELRGHAFDPVEASRLRGVLKANLAAMQKGMRTSFSNNPAGNLEPSVRPLLDAWQSATESVLASLSGSTADGSPSEFDALARRVQACFEANARLEALLLDQLDVLLHNRIAGFRQQAAWPLTLAVVMTLIAVYLLFGFYLGIMRTVRGLGAAAQSMMEHNNFQPVLLRTHDELGEVVRSFNGIATRLKREWTQAQEAEQRCRESEAKTRLIIDTAMDAVFTANEQGMIECWNPQAERIFQWHVHEIVGQPITTILPPAPETPSPDAGHLLQQLAGSRQEVVGCRKDGALFPAEIGVRLMPGAAGHASFGVFLTDITERKRAEQELQDAKAAALSASRAKSEFLANMSHEIRTPMNGIMGMVDLLLDSDLEPEQREYLEMARVSAESLLAIINDILDFSKIEAGKLAVDPCPFDLRDLVGSSIKSLALRSFNKGLELVYEVDPDVPDHLEGDAGRIRQILINLVGNAIKFTAAGEVALHVSLEQMKGATAQLLFKVRDTGIGIAPENREAIFRAFEQADTSTTRRFGGTGLGLTISSQLIHIMGGQIWVESELGKGSTFLFRLPLKVLARKAASSPAQMRSLEGLPVLVVDDHEINLRLLHAYLTNWGMKPVAVETASAALMAIENAQAAGRPFRLVLTDVMMPEVDGFTLAETIKRSPECAQVPILILSSAGRPEDGARCRALGLAGCLMKPITQSDLLEAIIAAVDGVLNAGTKDEESLEKNDSAPVERLRILLVEDHVVNQRIAIRLLEKLGHEVVVAGNGLEAVSAHAKQGRFDLILMDVQMPEMDGLTATGVIRQQEQKQGGRTPIVAMTAHAMKGDRERCLNAGMDDYISKPIRSEELLRVLHGVSRNRIASPPPSEASTRFTFDRNEAINRLGGDEELLDEIADLIQEEGPKLVDAVEMAIDTGDPAALRRAAHTLKGCLSNFGPSRAESLARSLEEMGRGGQLLGARDAFAELKETVEELIHEVRAHCGAGIGCR